jgi:hypothetical protein
VSSLALSRCGDEFHGRVLLKVAIAQEGVILRTGLQSDAPLVEILKGEVYQSPHACSQTVPLFL